MPPEESQDTARRHLTALIRGEPLAIKPEYLAILASALSAAPPQRPEAAKKPPMRSAGATAIIPLYGVIAPRADLIDQILFGMTGLDSFAALFNSALQDTRVRSIVIDVNSPGGMVHGVDEASAVVYAARGIKPVTAIANAEAASAAYWIASAAEEFVVTPSGEVGSIGIVGFHEDLSGMLAQQGVKVTVISEGKYKAEGNPFEPLSESAQAYMQAQAGAYYDMMTTTIARNRGVTTASVRGGFGEGRMLMARDAVRAGMVDRIATMDAVLARHGGAVVTAGPDVNQIEQQLLGGERPDPVLLSRLYEIMLADHDTRELAGAVQ